MGREGKFPPEKLVIPLLYSSAPMLSVLYSELQQNFGPIDYTSRVIPFTFSSYYDREMGPELRRLFLGFEELVNPGDLWRIKKETNRMEALFSENRDRKINLDPGLLDLNRLVLATTKHAGHRIPLAEGIYAEITLYYRRGRFESLPWTYPDYRSDEYQQILLNMREIFHGQLKHLP